MWVLVSSFTLITNTADVVLLGQAAVTPGDLTITVPTELHSHTEGGWTKTLGPSAL